MIKNVKMRWQAILWFCAIEIFLFCGNGGVLFGNTIQVDIDPKGAFMLNSNTTFEHFCAPCHGETGAGDGRYYPSDLSPSPRDFTDAEFMKSKTDDQVFTAINEGSAAVGRSNRCPPWGRILEDEKIEEMVVYLQSLSATTVEQPSGATSHLPQQGDKGSSGSIWKWILMVGLVVIMALLAVHQWRKKPFDPSIALEKK